MVGAWRLTRCGHDRCGRDNKRPCCAPATESLAAAGTRCPSCPTRTRTPPTARLSSPRVSRTRGHHPRRTHACRCLGTPPRRHPHPCPFIPLFSRPPACRRALPPDVPLQPQRPAGRRRRARTGGSHPQPVAHGGHRVKHRTKGLARLTTFNSHCSDSDGTFTRHLLAARRRTA